MKLAVDTKTEENLFIFLLDIIIYHLILQNIFCFMFYYKIYRLFHLRTLCFYYFSSFSSWD